MLSMAKKCIFLDEYLTHIYLIRFDPLKHMGEHFGFNSFYHRLYQYLCIKGTLLLVMFLHSMTIELSHFVIYLVNGQFHQYLDLHYE